MSGLTFIELVRPLIETNQKGEPMQRNTFPSPHAVHSNHTDAGSTSAAYVLPADLEQMDVKLLLIEMLHRMRRVETRLVKLMIDHGLDNNGKPID